jgi:hypothetical protein
MAELVHEIIARDLWKKLHYPSFGAFALSSTGLAINSDQKLLLLRTCLDVHGRDLKHWAEICVQIDALVRCRARKEGQKISSLRKTSHSLRTLARDRATGGIRWLPSYQRGPATLDGDLVRMHRTQPEIYERVVAGEVSLAEVRRQSRPPPAEVSSPFTRLRRLIESQVQFLTPPQKATLREMLA